MKSKMIFIQKVQVVKSTGGYALFSLSVSLQPATYLPLDETKKRGCGSELHFDDGIS